MARGKAKLRAQVGFDKHKLSRHSGRGKRRR